jgi:hypothetical protein
MVKGDVPVCCEILGDLRVRYLSVRSCVLGDQVERNHVLTSISEQIMLIIRSAVRCGIIAD